MARHNVTMNVTSTEADIVLFLRNNVNFTKELGKIATERLTSGPRLDTVVTLLVDIRDTKEAAAGHTFDWGCSSTCGSGNIFIQLDLGLH